MCDMQKAIERGAKGVKEPWEESDETGTVTFAVIKTVRDMAWHVYSTFCLGLPIQSMLLYCLVGGGEAGSSFFREVTNSV